jgi:adenylate cyclase
MAEVRVERRLAAILAADVAGYSRLMGIDEEGTLAALKASRRELVDPKVAEHRGRIVKTTGDGALVEFPSAVDAVRCAADIQRAMAARNASIPEDRRIAFRIGINVGDIIMDEGDIYGDGVNIAARVEALAEPGGVCLSEYAYQQIKGKVNLDFVDLGEQRLKNIAATIRVYGVRWDEGGHVARETLALPDKPSIAVLAFQNMSGDPEQEHFADGIAEDIITALSKSRWLFVIARNSSFAYKGRTVDIKQIGRELGVRFVLEGSVRKAGTRVRITGQLIEATTGTHLWAERYDRDLTDIFAVQDEITENVAAAIEPAMAHAERQRVSRKPPDSLDAWEAYHRGLWHFLNQEFEENQKAKTFFQRAIDLDHGFAAGHAALALCSVWDGWVYASRPMEECVAAARPLAQRALALDNADSMSHFAMGFVLHMGGDITGGCSEYERAISLNPNHAWAVGALGGLYANDGRPESALTALSKAMRASPHDPLMWIWMLWVAATHFYAGEFQAAVDAANRLIRFRPDKSNAYRFKAAALGHLGQIEEANKALNMAIEVSPPNFDYFVRKRPTWMRAIDHDLQIDGLRKAGLPDK